jgi:hypothetical protein
MEQVSSSWYGPDDGYQAETGRPVIIARFASTVSVVVASSLTYPNTPS